MSEASFENSGTTTPSHKVMAKLNLVQASMNNSCSMCEKRVYDMEKIAIDNQLIFHKNCFRCSTCRGILTVRNFTMVDGELFCKQHYLRQFKEVGGKYNFTSLQTPPAGQAARTTTTDAVASPARSVASPTTNGSNLVDTPRPVKTWEPTSSNSREIPKDASRPPPMVELCRSPTGLGPTGAGVASIRSMFETKGGKVETPRGGKVDQKSATSPSAAHGQLYVEGEESVISMMKNQSSVKSRQAKLGGTGGAFEELENDEYEQLDNKTLNTIEQRQTNVEQYDALVYPEPAIQTPVAHQRRPELENDDPEPYDDDDDKPGHADDQQDGDEQQVGHRDYFDENDDNDDRMVHENGDYRGEHDVGHDDYPDNNDDNDDRIVDDCNRRDGNYNDDYSDKYGGHVAPEEDQDVENDHQYHHELVDGEEDADE